MNITLYKNIVNVVNRHHGLSTDCLSQLVHTFPNVDKDTLYSILSYKYLKRMRTNHMKSQAVRNKYWELYLEGLKNSESPGIIVRIATNVDVAPCLVAKLILQKFLENQEEHDADDDNKASIKLNYYMRNTNLIPDMDLAYEIFLCTLYDNLYSPLSEVMKNSIGQQYEIKLHKEIVNLGLAFRDEEALRKFGYDKTPDVKLEVPVAMDGFVINWIESKALFGNEEVHKEYTHSQYLSYWNRFGTGLVIYWFGYVETLTEQNNKQFIIRDKLPSNVVHIVPPETRVEFVT